MLVKIFEQVVRFYEVPQGSNVPSMWLPLVNITLITPANNRVNLSLLFDTGANVTTLRADLYPILGLKSWDQGEREETSTGGGKMVVYKYTYNLEIFGKTIINCPIHLNSKLLHHPLFSGCLGRDTVFNEFGFGFWENTHELYITTNL
jgi:hypothetical protein